MIFPKREEDEIRAAFAEALSAVLYGENRDEAKELTRALPLVLERAENQRAARLLSSAATPH